jgi:hypothetical protein
MKGRERAATMRRERDRARTALVVQSRRTAGLCIRCGGARGQDGTRRMCRRCADKEIVRGHERRQRLRAAGKCCTCGNPLGAGGTGNYCRRCLDRNSASTRERYQREVAAGKCTWCGEPRGEDGTYTLCRRHADAIATSDRARYQSLIKEGLCPEHQQPMCLLKLCPACCYETSNMPASDVSFVGLLPPPTSGERLEACVGCERCGRCYHQGGSYYFPHYPPGLKLRDEQFVREIAAEDVRAQSAEVVGAVKVKRAAELLDMTEWRVRKLIAAGRLEVVHPMPNTIRIPLSTIRQFLEGES